MDNPWGSLQAGSSLTLILLVSAWEALAPNRPRPPGMLLRWGRNLAVGAIGILATHAVPGGVLLAVSAWGRARGLGLLQEAPLPLAVLLTVLALDLSLWAQHKVSHEWTWLWRLHQVHHGDLAMDMSTAFRFHPLELAVSVAWKGGMVLLLGGPLGAVALFESLLLAGNVFEHANGRLATRLDLFLRLGVVTPALHVIHHSLHPGNQQSNYGFFLIFWDRIFHTLRTRAEGSCDLGLGDGRERTLLDLLRQPFQPSPVAPAQKAHA